MPLRGVDEGQGLTARRVSRRWFLGLAGGALLGAAYMLLTSRPQPAEPNVKVGDLRDLLDPEGKRYLPDSYIEFLEWLREVGGRAAGKSINVALMTEGTALSTQRIERDFFNVSGINARLDISPYNIHAAKTLAALTTRSRTYDVVAVEAFDMGIYSPHLYSIEELAEENPDYTYEKLEVEDLNRYVLDIASRYPPRISGVVGGSGRMLTMPFSSPLMIHFYRRDLYEEAGFEPAGTWEEYLEDLRAFHNPDEGMFGTAVQVGNDIGLIMEFNNYLCSFGGNFWRFDEKGAYPAMNTDEAVAALELFVSVSKYADPGSISYDWDAVATAMRRGRISNAIQWQDFAWMMDDPVRSFVVGKVGYKLNPAGPEGPRHQFIGDSLGVSRYSDNKVAAWLWIQWVSATGTRILMTLDPKAKIVPIRESTYEDPMVREVLSKPGYESILITKEALERGLVCFIPPLPKWSVISTMIGKFLRAAWAGKNPREALREMEREIERLSPISF